MAQPGIRAAQLADLIRDYLASWVHQDLPGRVVSITQVTLSSDIQRATVWVTTFPREQQAGVLRQLTKHEHSYSLRLRRALQRRNTPSLSFALDTLEEDAERIDELLK